MRLISSHAMPIFIISAGRRNAAVNHCDDAVSDMDHAIALKQDFAEAIFNRGGIFYARHAFGRAIADFDQFIRLKPQEEEGYKARGLARDAFGELDNAVSDFDSAIRLSS